MQKIRKGDSVVLICGKDKGKRGVVASFLPPSRVLVEGLNVVKKHQKPDPSKGLVGCVVERSMPLHVSNVALVDRQSGLRSAVGFRVLQDGRKVRYFKSNGELLKG